jgi:D-aspartate ligase
VEGALVVGGDYRGLGVVRSLGRRGIPVTVLVDGDDVLATRSRYCLRSLPLAGPTDEAQVEHLLRLADEGLAGATLFPTSDRSAALVARSHGALAARFVLTTPPWKTLQTAFDKRATYALAGRLGIDHPRTWRPESAAALAALPIELPAIVKPAVREVENALTVEKAWRADSRQELAARFAEALELLPADELMVQELVPGGGEHQFSYAALADGGRPLATVVARRTRQFPVDFGRASTFVETVDEPGVVQSSERLLAELRWDGLIELEYKRHAETGAFKLLDMNPRVWGWQSLCGRAGVDFPYLAWRLAHGEPVERVHGRPGVRWVRHSTDVPTALREILGRRMPLGPYLRTLRGPVENAIYASDDRGPGLYEYPMLASRVVRRLAQGRHA